MNLDAFISSAVKAVRNSKKQGKAGASARKELKKSENKFEQIKAEIKSLAQAIEKREWRETSLVHTRTIGYCKQCGTKHFTSAGSIMLEQTHARHGKLFTRIPDIQADHYSHLPREIKEVHLTEGTICEDCFTSFNANQGELDLWPSILPDARPSMSRRIEKFHAEQREWTRKCINWMLYTYASKYPALPAPLTKRKF